MSGRRGELPDDILAGSGSYIGQAANRLALTGRKRPQRRWGERPARADDPADRTRHTYYVGDALHWRIMQLAEEYGVPVSDMARWLLRRAVEMVESREWRPRPEPIYQPRKKLP